MKIFITGYSGLLGRHLAKTLKRNGHYIRVNLHKKSLRIAEMDVEADELIWGSLEELDVIKKGVSGMDWVIHCAWKFNPQTASRPTNNELITKSIFKESKNLGVKKFAFVSSIAVYGMKIKNTSTITEETSLVSGDDLHFIYPSEKTSLEQWLLKEEKNDMLLGIFRPGPIFDDIKSPIKILINKKKNSYGLGFGNGRNHMPYIHAEDVANGMTKWLEASNVDGIYNLTPSRCMTSREWYKGWGSIKKMKIIPIFIPTMLLRLGAFGGTMVKRLLGKPGKIDVNYTIAASTRDQYYCNDHAQNELNWIPVLTETLIQNASKK